MKLGYFSLIMVLTIIFSLGTVAASENITADASVLDDVLASDNQGFNEDLSGLSESHDILKDDSSDDVRDNCDLIVRTDVVCAYDNGVYNPYGSEVPWTVVVIANGTAHNVRVYVSLFAGLEFISYNLTDGQYDYQTERWDVGDLSNSNATLTILTKLTGCNGTLDVSGYSDSNDTDTFNNELRTSIMFGSSEVISEYVGYGPVIESDDKEKPSHDGHYISKNNDLTSVDREDDTSKANSNTAASDIVSKSKSDKNSESGRESVSNSIVNGNPFESLTVLIDNIFNQTSSVSDTGDSNLNESSNTPVKAIAVYDYTKIPLLIFALFFIISLPIIAYDKIKS